MNLSSFCTQNSWTSSTERLLKIKSPPFNFKRIRFSKNPSSSQQSRNRLKERKKPKKKSCKCRFFYLKENSSKEKRKAKHVYCKIYNTNVIRQPKSWNKSFEIYAEFQINCVRRWREIYSFIFISYTTLQLYI